MFGRDRRPGKEGRRIMNVSCCRPVVAAASAAVIAIVAGAAGAGGDDLTPDPQTPATEYTLRLGEASFDPLIAAPEVAEGWQALEAVGPELRLVQLAGPTRAAWLDQLEAAGLEIVQYIYPYTYIVWSEPQDLDAARALAGVRWAGEFHPAYRVLPRWRNLPEAPLKVTVLVYRGVDTDAVVRTIARRGPHPGRLLRQARAHRRRPAGRDERPGLRGQLRRQQPGLPRLPAVARRHRPRRQRRHHGQRRRRRR
jgi:hypothetical protein